MYTWFSRLESCFRIYVHVYGVLVKFLVLRLPLPGQRHVSYIRSCWQRPIFTLEQSVAIFNEWFLSIPTNLLYPYDTNQLGRRKENPRTFIASPLFPFLILQIREKSFSNVIHSNIYLRVFCVPIYATYNYRHLYRPKFQNLRSKNTTSWITTSFIESVARWFFIVYNSRYL